MAAQRKYHYRAGTRLFKTIQEACEYASYVFRTTGKVIAIERRRSGG